MQTVSEVRSVVLRSALIESIFDTASATTPDLVAGGVRTASARFQGTVLPRKQRRFKLALRNGFHRPSISNESYTWEGRGRVVADNITTAITQLSQLGFDFWLGYYPIKQYPKPMGGINFNFFLT